MFVQPMIGKNINISAKESLGCFELKKHKPQFDKGNKLNFSGYRIQVK
jgi:hypothetical protein